MRRGDTKAESGTRGGTAWNDGLHPVDGGGSSNGSIAETPLFSFGAGESGRGGDDAVSHAAWFAPIEEKEEEEEVSNCPGGVCPVPWAVKEEAPKILPDTVDHPPHYTEGVIECIEAIEAQLTPEAYEGYLQGNCAKYLWRWQNKGGVTDLKKCRWYLDRLIQLKEDQNG